MVNRMLLSASTTAAIRLTIENAAVVGRALRMSDTPGPPRSQAGGAFSLQERRDGCPVPSLTSNLTRPAGLSPARRFLMPPTGTPRVEPFRRGPLFLTPTRRPGYSIHGRGGNLQRRRGDMTRRIVPPTQRRPEAHGARESIETLAWSSQSPKVLDNPFGKGRRVKGACKFFWLGASNSRGRTGPLLSSSLHGYSRTATCQRVERKPNAPAQEATHLLKRSAMAASVIGN